MQALSVAVALKRSGKAISVNRQFRQPLSQSIAIDAEQLRRSQLIAPGLRERIFHQGLFECGQCAMIQCAGRWMIVRQPQLQRTFEIELALFWCALTYRAQYLV